jgi:hypothetical protein
MIRNNVTSTDTIRIACIPLLARGPDFSYLAEIENIRNV